MFAHVRSECRFRSRRRSIFDPSRVDRVALERAKAETAASIETRDRNENTDRAYRKSLKEGEDKHQAEILEIERRAADAKKRVLERFETERGVAEKEHNEVHGSVASKAAAELEAIVSGFEEGRWQTLTTFESERERLKKHFDGIERHLVVDLRTLEPLQAAAAESLESVAKFAPDWDEPEPESPTTFNDEEGPVPALRRSIAALDAMLVKLLKLGLPKFLKYWQDLIIDVLVWLTLMIGLWALKVDWTIRLVAASVATLLFAAVLRVLLTKCAKRQVEPIYKELAQALSESERIVEVARGWTSTVFQERSPRSKPGSTRRRKKANATTPAVC